MSSISDWSPSETLRVGQDPGGSRVLEALVNAGAASKAKKKLLRKLKGMWAVLAVEPGGNHVVESCFIWGVQLFTHHPLFCKLVTSHTDMCVSNRGPSKFLKNQVQHLRGCCQSQHRR